MNPMPSSPITLMAVGDVFLDRPNPTEAFSLVADVLRNADIRFANNEGVYTTLPDRAPNARGPVIAHPDNAVGLDGAGFTVMSVANNHIVDGGHRGLAETLRVLHARGVTPVGAGDDAAAAHRPAVINRGAMRIAFLAYSSVFPDGYEARAAIPGLAPMRAYDLYIPYERHEWNPGLVPQVVSALDDEDAERVQTDIAEAKKVADIVVVSTHWGDFSRPFVLTDHERQCARMFVDAGADVVLGHHHHFLRGVEWYEGRPIFYGLGHFVFDQPHLAEQLAAEGAPDPSRDPGLRRRFGDYGIWPRDGYPLLPFHPDARMTVIGVVRGGSDGITEAGVIPCLIRPDGRPQPCPVTETDGRTVLAYLQRCCDEEALSTRVAPVPDAAIPYARLVPADSEPTPSRLS
jgi:hypothetical protein